VESEVKKIISAFFACAKNRAFRSNSWVSGVKAGLKNCEAILQASFTQSGCYPLRPTGWPPVLFAGE
jgi:hypothetical protein